jgi:hypothetical protein
MPSLQLPPVLGLRAGRAGTRDAARESWPLRHRSFL